MLVLSIAIIGAVGLCYVTIMTLATSNLKLSKEIETPQLTLHYANEAQATNYFQLPDS